MAEKKYTCGDCKYFGIFDDAYIIELPEGVFEQVQRPFCWKFWLERSPDAKICSYFEIREEKERDGRVDS